MNNPNPTSLPEEEPVAAASEAAQPAVAPAPPAPVPNDTRRRLRDLLSIPERDRSDEQWDEIIELEIQLAPGNRISGNERPGHNGPHAGHQSAQGKGGGQQQKKHRPRGNPPNNPGGGNNRRPRGNKPQSGGGHSGSGGAPA